VFVEKFLSPTIEVGEEARRHPSAGGRAVSSVRKHDVGTVEEYAKLPYHVLLVRTDEEKGKPWSAAIEELPGCTSQGKTSEEALRGVQQAMESWITTALAEGRDVPVPKSAASHSGRLLLRMPRTLHADLTRASEREGVSLNQFITDVLAAAVAWRGRGVTTTAGPDGTRSPLNQEPGAEGLTTEPSARQRGRRNPTNLVTAALAANFVIVGIAGVVAIIVLIAAWF
jgi:antitoxin HicB